MGRSHVAGMKVRRAESADGSQIAAIIQGSFAPHILGMTIYGCTGIVNYIRAHIEIPDVLAETHYFVATDGSKTIGCIELRQIHDALYLNYIAVHAHYRRLGVASMLLEYALKFWPIDRFRTMQLDVFDQNETAMRWYTRLGFRELHQTGWYELTLEKADIHPGTFISGYPQANTCHKEFGFSQFQVVSPNGVHNVGRIGEKWFRTTSAGLLSDSLALAALRRLDAQRNLFAVLTTEDAKRSRPDVKPLLITRHLEVSLTALQRNIDSK